jgi:hypothetical protein
LSFVGVDDEWMEWRLLAGHEVINMPIEDFDELVSDLTLIQSPDVSLGVRVCDASSYLLNVTR